MVVFVLTAVGLTLTGVLSPGPITAATLAAGTRHRHAGAMIAFGHIAIEFPAIVLLFVGLSDYLKSPHVRAGIGLAGGAFLLLSGVQLLLSIRVAKDGSEAPVQRHPFWIGAILTATSPYFWFWGFTVALELTIQAMMYGAIAVALLALIHWMCDVGWLELLSLAGFKGSELLGPQSQQVVSFVCGVMLLGFGGKFLWDASAVLSGSLI